jgi:hypothetical protein
MKNGVICTKVDGKRTRAYAKPWPNNIDKWTHYYHGADGNAVARDRKNA